MLRQIFDKPKRIDSGHLLSVNQTIEQFCSSLRKHFQKRNKVPPKFVFLELRAKAFISDLNELEQSKFCCEQYQLRIGKPFEEEMNALERDDYDRFNYYYKNAFIRVFSILDKLGYFLNDFLMLDTGKIKSKFSYYTVLRRMFEIHAHPKLQKRLYDLKINYDEPMQHLRKKRNLEIHSMSVELLNDISSAVPNQFVDQNKIEPLEQNVADLQIGFEMVCRSLYEVFTYCEKLVDRGNF